MIKHILYIFSCFVMFVGEKMRQAMMRIFKGNCWENVVWLLQKKDFRKRSSGLPDVSVARRSQKVLVSALSLLRCLSSSVQDEARRAGGRPPDRSSLCRWGQTFERCSLFGCDDVDVLVCAEAVGDMSVCYILDGILVLFGAILTILYFRLKVRPTESSSYICKLLHSFYDFPLLKNPCF